ncbi:MAG TPA: M28 family peptidase, partial [Lacibacter sp.]|nr:M28 family peptidase [Lacibacter sp.]
MNTYLGKMKQLALLLLLAVGLEATAQSPRLTRGTRAAMNRVDTQHIRSHIAYLADDRLQGRLPGTPGYQQAVAYVVDQYRKLGVQPGGDQGTYLQQLVIRRSVVRNASALAYLKDSQGNTDTLQFVTHFTPQPHPLRQRARAEGQLVFAGYGVEIPGQYSDYAGVDVKGKIVVLVNGAPGGLSSTLTAHFSNPGNKMNTAAAKGALGVILVSLAPAGAGSSNPVVQANVALNPEKTVAYGRRFTGNLDVALTGSYRLLQRLFLHSGHSLSHVQERMQRKEPVSFDLPGSLAVSYETTHTDFESQNVVGLIPGTDPRLRNEYVVHSAHLDHLGIGRPVNGDSIYNGAHDNASGVASLLEIARLYRTSGVRPKRSVLIVMVTGEEMGLIGSSYFAANPTVPRGSIVANVNTDMPTLIAPLLSIVPLGAEHSTLMQHVQWAAGQLGLDVEADPEPNENRFVRSDQYSFVMNGIPAVHVKYGNKSDVPGFDLVRFVREWRAKYYHQAADGMDGIFYFPAGKTYVQLNFLISYSVAQAEQRPAWNPGDLFGAGNYHRFPPGYSKTA